MKYLVLPLVTAFLVGTLSVATAETMNSTRAHRGSGCSSNPYTPGHTLGCESGAAAKKKNALVKHHTGH
jgi:hypothetical protein